VDASIRTPKHAHLWPWEVLDGILRRCDEPPGGVILRSAISPTPTFSHGCTNLPLTPRHGSVYSGVTFNIDGRRSSVSFDEHTKAVKFCDLVNRVGPQKALEVIRR
jgi:hypothetical protein